MDSNGHIYMGLEDEIPAEDKARLDGYLRARAERDAELMQDVKTAGIPAADGRAMTDLSHERTEQHMSRPAKQCDQCGRKGTHGFVTIPSDHKGPTDGVDSFTVCKANDACRKRRKEAAYPDD